VGEQGGDFLVFQSLPRELPTMTGVYRTIDPLICQDKKDATVGWTDEQLLNSLLPQTSVAGLPGASFVF
jgi:hypothetical protein